MSINLIYRALINADEGPDLVAFKYQYLILAALCGTLICLLQIRSYCRYFHWGHFHTIIIVDEVDDRMFELLSKVVLQSERSEDKTFVAKYTASVSISVRQDAGLSILPCH